MPRRRFDTDELEEMAVRERLTRETKRSLLRELGGLVHRAILLVVALKGSSEKKDLVQWTDPQPDRLIRPSAAIDSLGVSRQYIYDHECELPFCVRLPSGALRISERRMVAWIEERKCAGSETPIGAKALGIGGSDTASGVSLNTKARSRRRNPTLRDS